MRIKHFLLLLVSRLGLSRPGLSLKIREADNNDLRGSPQGGYNILMVLMFYLQDTCAW